MTRRQLLSLISRSAAGTLMAGGCIRRGHSAAAIEPIELGLHGAARAIRAGSLSPIELTEQCLDRISRFDGVLNAFITVTREQALADARRAAREIANGRRRGPLHGIPIGIKDNLDTKGVRTTAASAVFADRVPVEDADVVRRLRDAGAVLVGKLNMHEAALGTTSVISAAGPVRNPWEISRIAGGSSGGSGAAVAAGFCLGAVGTDTGGSIRIPAACCGVVGLKPTHGVVSLAGTIAVSSSFDHVGPLCRTVADAALMFHAMTDHPVARMFDPDAPGEVSQPRIGVVRIEGPTCDDASLHPEVQQAFDVAVDVLRSLGARTEEVSLPMPDLGRVIDVEAYAFHAPYLAAAPERYDPRTRDLLLAKRGISEAEATRLHDQLARYRATYPDVLRRVDVVALPTLPILPIEISKAGEPFAMPACTFAFSLGGWPAVSVPCGYSQSGLPIGLMLGGPPLSEPTLLALAHAYEQATPWRHRRPPPLPRSA